MKGSKYNLGMSLMYLRLAYQSMSKDQDEAARVVAIWLRDHHLMTKEEQLCALAEIVLAKVMAEIVLAKVEDA
jgi:hypothetical protein